MVVMHRNEDRHFNIAIQDMSTSDITVLTSSSSDESPSLAPNGRLVVYATKHGSKGILGVASVDGHTHLYLPSREGDQQEPAWSPYLGQ
jgi:TolB protein